MELNKIRILIVEKEGKEILRVAKAIEEVNDYNFEFETVSRVSSILDCVQSVEFDLILLDLDVEDSSGISSLIKAQDLASDIPIVVIDDEDDDKKAIAVVQQGAQDYILKSEFKGHHLVRSIHHAIDRNRLRLELRTANRQNAYLATHDPLTKLPNRQLFNDRLAQSLARVTRYQHQSALFYMDLDDFKEINDKYGHAVGDNVLRAVAGRISGSLRKTDTVARMGGDEFTIIVTMIKDKKSLQIVLDKLIKVLSKPFVVDDVEINLGVSIGVAIAPDDGDEADTLLKKSDYAMYCAKEDGGGCYRMFSELE